MLSEAERIMLSSLGYVPEDLWSNSEKFSSILKTMFIGLKRRLANITARRASWKEVDLFLAIWLSVEWLYRCRLEQAICQDPGNSMSSFAKQTKTARSANHKVAYGYLYFTFRWLRKWLLITAKKKKSRFVKAHIMFNQLRHVDSVKMLKVFWNDNNFVGDIETSVWFDCWFFKYSKGPCSIVQPVSGIIIGFDSWQ